MIEIEIPPSKSLTHRALLLGALSTVPCRVRRPLWGADCRSTLGALVAMGARAGGEVRFSPIEELRAPKGPIDCGNSGTTLRLLLGQVARLSAPVVLTGDASLQRRPNGPLISALSALGAEISAVPGGRAPIRVRGPVHAGQVALGPSVSSQFASSLLLAGAMVPGAGSLSMAAPVASRPYLDLTLDLADEFGLDISVEEGPGLVFRWPGGQRPAALEHRVEGDWSTAAFPLVAAAINGRALRLRGLRADSRQGDRVIVELIGRFGPALHWGDGLELQPQPLVAAGEIDLGASPDLFPALCVLAACAEGRTVLAGAPSLRDKESDRIAAMATGLERLGIEVEERPDGLVIDGGRPVPNQVESHGDHRIYMAFRLLGGPVSGAGCESVSYPDFERDLAKIRG